MTTGVGLSFLLRPIMATFETGCPVFINHDCVAATQRERNGMNGERLTKRFTPVHALEFGVYTVDSRKSLIGKEAHLEIILEAVWRQIWTRRLVHTSFIS